MKRFLLALIRFYRKYISPAFPGKCRRSQPLRLSLLQNTKRRTEVRRFRLPPRRLPHPAAQAAFQEEFNGIYPHPLWLSVGVPL